MYGALTYGPYGPQDPRVFFDADFYPFAFNPELGSVGVPVSSSLRPHMLTYTDVY